MKGANDLKPGRAQRSLLNGLFYRYKVAFFESLTDKVQAGGIKSIRLTNLFLETMKPDYRSLYSVPVVVAALGYFVDIYDLLLFSIVRIASLKSLGVTDDALMSTGEFLIQSQMTG